MACRSCHSRSLLGVKGFAMEDNVKKLMGFTAGSVMGGKTGAVIGATIGTFLCPGAGTIIGAKVGAVLGATAGGVGGATKPEMTARRFNHFMNTLSK